MPRRAPTSPLSACRSQMENPNARDSDQQAAEITAAVGAAALGVGTAILTDPAGGAIVGAATAPAIKATLDRVFGLRGRQVAAMVEIAVRAAGQTHDELLERVTTDRHRAQLFSAAVRAAANTALESKLTVLGQLLAEGLLHDEQAVDEARLLTTTIEEVERLHLRILDHLTKDRGESLSEEEDETAGGVSALADRWPFDRLAEALGVTPSVLEIATGLLLGRGLIHGTGDTYGTPTSEQMAWRLTGPGKAVLELFRRAGETAAGQSAPEHDERAPRDDDGDIK
jgi:hypothetical protein